MIENEPHVITLPLADVVRLIWENYGVEATHWLLHYGFFGRSERGYILICPRDCKHMVDDEVAVAVMSLCLNDLGMSATDILRIRNPYSDIPIN